VNEGMQAAQAAPRRVGSALEPTNSLARRIAYEIASQARNDGGLPLVNEGRQAAQTAPRRVGSALEPTNSLARKIGDEIASRARNDGEHRSLAKIPHRARKLRDERRYAYRELVLNEVQPHY
ncbi:MAG: hypothetical protein WBI14_01555, partial [Anaerolineaceae bacterium]